MINLIDKLIGCNNHLPTKIPVWRNIHFWSIVVLMTICTMFYYMDVIIDFFGWKNMHWSIFYTVHDLHRTLFLIPVLYVAFIYRTKGAIITTLLSLLIFLPRVLLVSPYPDPLLRVSIFIIYMGILGVLLSLFLNSISERIKLEQNLQKINSDILCKTRDYLDSLINYSNAPIIAWDSNQLITIFNAAFERMSGFVSSEILGQPLSVLFPEASKEDSIARIKHAIDGEHWETMEIPILHKNGSIRIALWNSANIYDKSGTTLIATIAQGQDITECKHAEIEITHKNRVLRMLSDANQVLIHHSDEETLLNEICRIIVEVGGYRMSWVGYAEHDEAKTLRPVAHAGFDSGYIESAKVTWGDDERGRGPGGIAIRTGQPCLLRNILLDPNFIPWREAAIKHGYKSIIVFPLISEGETFGAIGIYSDEIEAFDVREIEILKVLAEDVACGIKAVRTRAERDRSEEALCKSNNELKEAQRLGQLGSWDWDAKTGTITWSEEYYHIFGLNPTQAPLGYEEHLKVYTPESANRLDMAVKRNRQTCESYELDLELAGGEGACRWITVCCETKRDDLGQIIGLRGTVQDITARKLAEKQILKLNRIYAVLSNINQAIVRIHDTKELLNEACRITIEYGKFRMAWIGMVNFQTNKVDVIASNGVSGDYLENINIDLSDKFRSIGPTGIAVLTGKHKISNNIIYDDNMIPWRDDAIKHGYKSSAAFPLIVSDKVVGAFNIYTKETDFFEEDDIQLLDEMAKDISFALEFMKAETERKHAEEALKKQYFTLHGIIESTDMTIFSLDSHYRYTSFNNRHSSVMKAIYGVKIEIGRNLLDYMTVAEDREKAKLNIDRALTGEQFIEEAFSGEELLSRLYFQVSHSPIRTEEGEIIGVAVLSHDITERKQTEEALRESEEKYRSVIESSPVGIFIIKNELVKYVNPSLFEMTGYTEQEVIGQPLLNFVPEKDRETIQKFYIKRTRGEIAPKNYVTAIILKNGTESPIEITVSSFYLLGEKAELVFVYDITERKEIERILLQNKQELESIYNTVEDMVFQLQVEGGNNFRFNSVNKAFENYTGLNASFIVGKLINEILPESLLSANILKCHDAGEHKALKRWEESLKFPVGILTCEFSVAPVLNMEGKCTHIVGSIHDITERKIIEERIEKLNEELEERVKRRTKQLEIVNKELEAFAHSVAHDLRAPLQSIDGFSQALLEDYQDKFDEQANNYLHRVRSAAQHMGQLIDDMLNLSRVSRSEMNIQHVDLSKMFLEIANDLQEAQPERKVEFIIQEGIKARGDRQLLRIVLNNLIGNAWKFTSKHPLTRIEFGMQHQKEKEVYFIRDDGAGFDINYAQNLFGTFQRLHTTSEFPGTGVGLATVQRVIHRHGGEVWAEGEIEKGATFYFTIP